MSSPDNLTVALAGVIRAERRAQERSHAEVFEPAGISRSTYHRYERGQRTLPVPALVAISDALNVDPADLIVRARAAVAGKSRP